MAMGAEDRCSVPAYDFALEVPNGADYCRLRKAAGLTLRSAAAAAAGLPHTVVGVTARRGEEVIGMGRVIGDGLFYQIVDIAVEPSHQGRGVGRGIMERLMAGLRDVAPAEAHVSLFADGEAHRLYAEFGFITTAPRSIGMAQWIGGPP